MKILDATLIAAVAFLAIFWEAAFDGVRSLLGAQPHLLPPLMVYTALRGSMPAVALLAFFGGLLFDSLSSNPLGISVLPLLVVGVAIHSRRQLILRSQVFAQSVLGAAASVAAPCFSILLLITLGQHPLLGWGTLWQIAVMGVAGAVAAPAFFLLFEWLQRTFSHSGPASETSFRPDREIRRGR
jgi:rod shape-determining protein MreD